MERSRAEELELEQREREAYDEFHRAAQDKAYAEAQYQAWCENRGLDPEDVGSMTAYDENPFHDEGVR